MIGGAWPGFVVRCVVIRMSAYAGGGVGCVGERGVRWLCCVPYAGACVAWWLGVLLGLRMVVLRGSVCRGMRVMTVWRGRRWLVE